MAYPASGPGLSVLSGAAHLGELPVQFPDLASHYAFVVIEEPWVTAPLGRECRSALRRNYAAVGALDGRADSTSDRVVVACDLGASPRRWGFDPSTYPDIVREIEARESFDVKGFVGVSFGNVRASYLPPGTYEWAVFLRPYPLGVSGEELLRARTSKLEQMSRNLAAGLDLAIEAAAAPSFASASASVALGYLTSAERTSAAEDVLGRRVTPAVQLLADRLWQVYGDGDISPAYLAEV